VASVDPRSVNLNMDLYSATAMQKETLSASLLLIGTPRCLSTGLSKSVQSIISLKLRSTQSFLCQCKVRRGRHHDVRISRSYVHSNSQECLSTASLTYGASLREEIPTRKCLQEARLCRWHHQLCLCSDWSEVEWVLG